MSPTEQPPLSVAALERYGESIDEMARRQKPRRFRLSGRGLAAILALLAVPAGVAVATELSDDDARITTPTRISSVMPDPVQVQQCEEILAKNPSDPLACEIVIAVDAGDLAPGTYEPTEVQAALADSDAVAAAYAGK